MNDEANLVLSMELDQKVNEKIRQVLFQVLTENPYAYTPYIGQALANDTQFITSMTRAIGSKMTNTY